MRRIAHVIKCISRAWMSIEENRISISRSLRYAAVSYFSLSLSIAKKKMWAVRKWAQLITRSDTECIEVMMEVARAFPWLTRSLSKKNNYKFTSSLLERLKSPVPVQCWRADQIVAHELTILIVSFYFRFYAEITLDEQWAYSSICIQNVGHEKSESTTSCDCRPMSKLISNYLSLHKKLK